MPPSKKRKGRGSGRPKSERDYQGPSQRQSSPVKPPMEPVNTPPPAPASTLGSARHEAPKLRRAPSGKFLIPAATVGLLGGGAYLANRHRRKNVTKSLFNPITGDEVLFEKAATNANGRRYERDYYSANGRAFAPQYGPFDDPNGRASARISRKGHEEGKGGAKFGGAVGLAGGAAFGGSMARGENKHQNVMRGYDKVGPLSRKARLARGGKWAAVGGALGGAYGAGTGYIVGDAQGRDEQIQREVARSNKGGKKGVRKAVSGPRGANFPDRTMGASTPMIGQTRTAGMLVPTGKYVSHANDLERFTPLAGYRKQPSGKNAQRLLHVKNKGRDRAAREYRGEVTVASKGMLVAKSGGLATLRNGFSMGGGQAKQGARRLKTFYDVGRANAGQAGNNTSQLVGAMGSRTQRGAYYVGQNRNPLAIGAAGGVATGGVAGATGRRKVEKADTRQRLGFNDVERAATFGRQTGRRGSRFA